MADIIRVKAKKNYEWDQDNKYVFVKVPMPGHTTIKNIEIYVSDLILRITSKQKKSAETLDLLKQVDYLSPQNKFVLADGVVSATLKKKTPSQKWQNLLIEDISLAQLKTRRKQSQLRYEQNIKNAQQTKQKLKTEYDRKATQQLMRFEEEERKKLDRRKEEEKQTALNQVFRNIDEKTGRIQYQGNKWEEKGLKALEQLEKEENQEYERQKLEKKRIQQQKYLKQSQSKNVVAPTSNKKNNIFSEEDVKYYDEIRNNVEQEIQEIPVRKQAKVTVKFTEKLYPNVATRDYHYTQPPMPKGSAPLPPPRQGDLENRNPLWLKDRGDAFMRDKNYSAALDAYNQAIKIDPTQRKILMNRSLAHMKLLNFDSALNDCEQVLTQMQKQLINNQQTSQQSLQDLIKMNTRKSIILAYKGKLPESKQLLSQQLSYSPTPQLKHQLQKCLQAITKRQESISIKLKGDQCVKRQAYSEAIGFYDRAIQVDGNQYAISNKALCLNKVQRYEESLEVCDRGIRIVEEFLATRINSANKPHPDYVTILIKLLYRKSNAQQFLKNLKQAQQTLTKALQLNPQDKDIKSSLKSLQSQKQTLQYQQLKQQASLQLTKNSNPQQALNLYTKCLKLVQSPQKVQQYLAILQNQCVCYLRLNQFDNIIAVSIRILTIINNLRNRVVEFGERRNYGVDKGMLDKIVVRTLMRRANAYLQTGQVYNAKSDLEKAVEVDPNDQTVVKELEKLKQSIGAN